VSTEVVKRSEYFPTSVAVIRQIWPLFRLASEFAHVDGHTQALRKAHETVLMYVKPLPFSPLFFFFSYYFYLII